MTPGKNIRVLVVDDDVSMLDLLTECLKKAGYSVSSADDGLKGLAAAEAAEHELIILDLLMPGMHGFDVCQKLRKNPKFKNTKILISSGKGYAVDIKAAKRLGADEYIVKPYEIKALYEKVEGLVGKP